MMKDAFSRNSSLDTKGQNAAIQIQLFALGEGSNPISQHQEIFRIIMGKHS